MDRALVSSALAAGLVMAGVGAVMLSRHDGDEAALSPSPPFSVSRYDSGGSEPERDPAPESTTPPNAAGETGVTPSPDHDPVPDPAIGTPDPAIGTPDPSGLDSTTTSPSDGSDDDGWSEATHEPAPPTTTAMPAEPSTEPAASALSAAPEPAGPVVEPDRVPSDPRPPEDDTHATTPSPDDGPLPAADPPARPPTTPLPGPPEVTTPPSGDPPAGPPIRGDTPGRRLALELALEAPATAAVGTAFEAVLVLRNAGDARLENVEVGVSAREGVTIDGAVEGLRRETVSRLEAGAVERRRVSIRPDRVGSVAILASCREGRGWAAAGATNRVEIVARGAPVRPERAALRRGPRLALALSSRAPRHVPEGEAYHLEFVLENGGDVHFRDVTLVLEPAPGTRLRGAEQRIEERIALLPVGERHRVEVVAHSTDAGTAILRASARDDRGWSASGVVQFVSVEPAAVPRIAPDGSR